MSRLASRCQDWHPDEKTSPKINPKNVKMSSFGTSPVRLEDSGRRFRRNRPDLSNGMGQGPQKPEKKIKIQFFLVFGVQGGPRGPWTWSLLSLSWDNRILLSLSWAYLEKHDCDSPLKGLLISSSASRLAGGRVEKK